jgi:hypothetical protein
MSSGLRWRSSRLSNNIPFMQPGIGRRLFAAFLALWFVVVATDQAMLHACPMHDGPLASVGAVSVTGGGAAGAHADHSLHSSAHGMAHGMAHGVAHGMAHGDAQRAAHETSPGAPAGDTPDAPHGCTCLGHCSASSPVNVAHSPETAFDATLTNVSPNTGLTQHEYVAAWVTFILPFATAPPRTMA